MTEEVTYRDKWDRCAGDGKAALEAVDNSASEQVARSTGGFVARQLLAALEIDANDTVLELGCGAGRIGRQVAPHCKQWIGVDISPNMIRVASQRLAEHDNIRLELLERTSLSMIEDASVDKVYTVAVLCHMDKEDLFLYLREIARILKPGGRAYLETWNLADPTGWQRWMYEVEFWNGSDQQRRKDVARNQFCVPEEFQLYADRAGLQPLVCFRDSPWVQIVAGKALDAESIEQERTRLAAVRGQIAYSPLFGRLFHDTVKVIYGDRHPREVVAEIEALPDCPEKPLYRDFVRGLWSDEPERFGPLDD
jgi:SAM-dependent methyltransferase